MDKAAAFALALQSMNGVGRVTAARLLHAFPAYEALAGYPREQVLLRIKRTPNAGAIAKALFDRAAMESLLCAASEEIDALLSRGIRVMSAHSECWPVALDELPPARRPLLMYAYGRTEVLATSKFVSVSCEDAEAANLVGRLLKRISRLGYGAVLGLSGSPLPVPPQDGPTVLVLPMGLGKAPASVRPVMLEIVRRGGLLLSPFAMQHGVYRHDEREASLVMAALARVCVLVRGASASSPALSAAAWAQGAGRTVCALETDAAILPQNVRIMASGADLDTLLTGLDPA